MKRNPLYVFRDINSIGIYDTPINSLIQIMDSGPQWNNRVLVVELLSKDGIVPSTTIGQFLNDSSLYNIVADGTSGGELIKKTRPDSRAPEGIQGYKLLEANLNYYGLFGNNSIDFSFQISETDGFEGTTGDYSFAIGLQNTSAGLYSFSGGKYSKAKKDHDFSFGYMNEVDGGYSAAFGRNNIIQSLDCFAIGFQNTISGQGSITAGYNNTVGGDYSSAFGYQNKITQGNFCGVFGNNNNVSGNASFSAGYLNKATADFSIAFGKGTNAIEKNTFAAGENTTASGQNAFAINNNTIASGLESFAGGLGSKSAGEVSFSFGISTISSGDNSVSFGKFSIATGENSFALSEQTVAEGENSFAAGLQSKAIGKNSFALSEQTVAEGENSFSGGFNTKSNSEGAFAYGFNTEANGIYSAAFGGHNIANGNFSAAFGTNTISTNDNQVVIGQWNNPKQNTVFEAGVGISDAQRKNALEIAKNGEVNLPIQAGLIIDNNTNPELVVTVGALKNYTGNLLISAESQLEKIVENNKTGWRLLGSDPNYYGNIGERAVDFSYQTTQNNTKGATGDYSSAFGVDNEISGATAFGCGKNNIIFGENGFATGYLNEVHGLNSCAFNYSNNVSGDNSVAIGISNTVSGSSSFIGGSSNSSTGDLSLTWGANNTNTSDSSIILGENNLLEKPDSSNNIVFGFNNTIFSDSSLVFGKNNSVFSDLAYTIGESNEHLETYTFSLGSNLSLPNRYMVAFGRYNEGRPDTVLEVGGGFLDRNTGETRINLFHILDTGEVVAPSMTKSDIFNSTENRILITKEYFEDELTTIHGYLGRVTEFNKTGYRIKERDSAYYGNIGEQAVDLSYSYGEELDFGATGDYSFSVGYKVTSSGLYSVAIGSGTIASGNYSCAIGNCSEATSDNAFALGDHALAQYKNSFALGEQTATGSENQFVVGISNEISSDDIFAVGNGEIEESTGLSVRSTAFSVKKNGSCFAPSEQIADIDNDTSGKILVTKEAAVTSIPRTPEEFRIERMVKVTQAYYDSITPDPNTLYIIV